MPLQPSALAVVLTPTLGRVVVVAPVVVTSVVEVMVVVVEVVVVVVVVVVPVTVMVLDFDALFPQSSDAVNVTV